MVEELVDWSGRPIEERRDSKVLFEASRYVYMNNVLGILRYHFGVAMYFL